MEKLSILEASRRLNLSQASVRQYIREQDQLESGQGDLDLK